MEKKTNRCMVSTSKSAVESKKSQDHISNNGKLLPKSGTRRRESASNSLTSNKNDYYRAKPTFSKINNYRIFDKRPKMFNNMGRTETTRLGEVEALDGGHSTSQAQVGKQWVNFVYTSHLDRNQSRHNRPANKRPKYTKEHFLQANCQFIVNSSRNYQDYLHDPDAMVDWNYVEQINVRVSELPSCPICLNPPIAAKITQCGHIYCWACILHYLALSDKSWRTCPICFAPVCKKNLKSVISIAYEVFNVNDIITFKLMKCAKGSLTVYPSTTDLMQNNYLFNVSERKSKEIYSKLLLANHTEILTIIQREFNELEQQLNENENCPENCFVHEALDLLEQRKTLTNNEEIIINQTTEDSCLKLEKLDLTDSATCNNNNNQKLHYFYQANAGQHVFLHAINARMLEHTYGSLEFGPKEITGRILEKEACSITEDLRKKRRYLQHLPVTCQFEVVEIQLEIPIITEETLEEFSDQLEVRRKKRQQRAKEEKRHEKRIAAVENRLMGRISPVTNLHIESEEQFPMFELRHPSESDIVSDHDISPPNSVGIDNEHAGLSFAKMLKTNNNNNNTSSNNKAKVSAAWPSLSTSVSSKSNDTVKPTSWSNVTTNKTYSSPIGFRNRNNFDSSNNSSSNNLRLRVNNDDADDEFQLPVPVGSSSLADAFDMALQKTNKKTKKKKNK